jgi:hypothetical protein
MLSDERRTEIERLLAANGEWNYGDPTDFENSAPTIVTDLLAAYDDAVARLTLAQPVIDAAHTLVNSKEITPDLIGKLARECVRHEYRARSMARVEDAP